MLGLPAPIEPRVDVGTLIANDYQMVRGQCGEARQSEPSEDYIPKHRSDVSGKAYIRPGSQTTLNCPLVLSPRPSCKSRTDKNPNIKWVNTFPLPAKEK